VLDIDQIRRQQIQKKVTLAVTVASFVALFACALLFIPPLNDKLSGPPEYLRCPYHMTDAARRAKSVEDTPAI